MDWVSGRCVGWDGTGRCVGWGGWVWGRYWADVLGGVGVWGVKGVWGVSGRIRVQPIRH
jgi:hypothetical protein